VPFKVAAIARLELEFAEVSATWNVPIEVPAGMNKDVGIVAVTPCELACPNVTFAPPVGAFCVRVTVQFAVWPTVTADGEHTTLAICATVATVIEFPIPDGARASPVPVAPIVLVTPTGADAEAPDANVITALAITPSPMSVAFNPVSKQVYAVVEVAWHWIDFSAAAAAGPTVIWTALKSPGENVKVHWRLETDSPSALHDKGSVTVPVGMDEPVAKVNEEPCSHDTAAKKTTKQSTVFFLNIISCPRLPPVRHPKRGEACVQAHFSRARWLEANYLNRLDLSTSTTNLLVIGERNNPAGTCEQPANALRRMRGRWRQRVPQFGDELRKERYVRYFALPTFM
jgi:hypothetical protein